MPKKTFTDEYKRRMVDLVRAGREPVELAREFDVSITSIKRWVAQAGVDDGLQDGMTTTEREELVRLRREVARLQEERDILKKFAAWSAQEANWSPKKRSGS